jgi:hypothetical protein
VRARTLLAAATAAAAVTAFAPAAQADRVADKKAEFPPCMKAPTPADSEAAKNAHKAALEAYDRREFDRAARLWTEAYGFDCSRPRVFLNLGEAYEGSGDPHAALAMYELYTERSPGPAPPHLPPKMHELRVRVKQLDDSEPPLGFAPWIILGGGGAVLIAGGVLVGVGLSQASSAEEQCADPEARTGCPQTAIDDGEAGELMSQVGQGLLYTGAGIVAIALILEFAVNQADTEPAPRRAAWVTPVIGSDVAGLVVSGTF